MLKSLAIGLMTLSAAGATAAFAHNNGGDRSFHDSSQPYARWCETQKHCDKWQYQPPGNSDPSPAAAPEIDPAGAMGALTLLAGGLAVLRGRRRSSAV